MTSRGKLFDEKALESVRSMKYGKSAVLGWGPRQRLRFNYYTPDDLYETLLYHMIATTTVWLDIGCGRSIFPQNARLAQVLSKRCEKLVGIDPDKTIDDNTFVHEKHQCAIEEFKTESSFDLVSLRMVAEHISEPRRAMEKIGSLLKPGGKVVVYTINKHSPVPILTRLLPFSTHHYFKSYFWGTEEKDTFPVAYKMNTKKELQALFYGKFKQVAFGYLEDCTIFGRFRRLNYCELTARALFHKIGMVYPENCLLAVYERL